MEGLPMLSLPMSGILMYTDADVLCGRKGEAQKHVGNKTYRALVNLNKPLYASCRTTEKIKISRSIVAAIREQRGRFLEKDGITNTFYDIGDKKAVEKTSQALREGQAKLKMKMAMNGDYTENMTAEGTRTSLNGGRRKPQQQYQPPPAPHELDPYHSRPDHVRSRMDEAPANRNEVRWDPADAPRSRPTISVKAESNMSLMSDDVSNHFRDILQSDETRTSFDSGLQEALRNLDVPENPYYDGNDEEGYTEMRPPPPRQMLDVRMDSFRRQLMSIASPQNSTMSLVSNIGSVGASASGGGSSIPPLRSSSAQPNPFDATSDIHVAPRGPEPTVNEFHFKARPKDAVDDLLSVGGLSKLSLMSGVSEATLDQGAIAASGSGGAAGGRRLVHNGSSELTLDSALASLPRGSNRKLLAHHRGLSTRSAAMSEVSALDYLQENENEDE